LDEEGEMNKSDRTSDASRDRHLTAGFVVTGCVLAAAALLVGISDNPPGIALCYAASIAGVLAIAHRWRRPRRFLLLAAGALAGGVILAVLHNFPEVLGERMAEVPVVGSALGFIGAVFFLLALLVAPAAIAVGLVGAGISWRAGRRAPGGSQG
jgi:hypothetical protein